MLKKKTKEIKKGRRYIEEAKLRNQFIEQKEI
jgi:hypothetical protein